MLARTVLVGALALLTAAPAAHSAQTLKLDLADPANALPRGVTVESAALKRRATYVVTVSGTGSLWSPDASAPVNCGAPEPGAITEPTPGRAATPPTVDAAIVFAAPRGVPFLGGFACVKPTPTEPPAQAAFRMGTEGVLTAPVPVGGAPAKPAADHTYSYLVAGRGLPLQFQYADPLIYDNSGILTITVRTARECRVARCLPSTKPTRPGRPGHGSRDRQVNLGIAESSLPCVFRALPAAGGRAAAGDLCS